MVTAIIPAAGAGVRFGGGVPKQFLTMKNGKTVLENTVEVFLRAGVGEVFVTVQKTEDRRQMTEDGIVKKCINEIAGLAGVRVVEGGGTRAASIYAALRQIDPRAEVVLIHDGVRPLVSVALIEAVVEAARVHGAAVPGLPCADTLKEADERGFVVATPARARFFAAQTPQGFRREVISAAYAAACGQDLSAYTDDAALVEANNHPVFILPGDPRNLKITTPHDLPIANALWEACL